MVINSVKVELVQVTQVEECVFSAHKCCKKGILSTINNVDVETPKQGNTQVIPTDWSCNACYKTFDINDPKPWTCNKREDTCNEIMCIDCAQPKFHRGHAHPLYHISKDSIREIPEIEACSACGGKQQNNQKMFYLSHKKGEEINGRIYQR